MPNPSLYNDLIIVNARIYDPAEGIIRSSAVLVSGGKIIRMGDDHAVGAVRARGHRRRQLIVAPGGDPPVPLQEALDEAVKEKGEDCTIHFLLSGSLTVPLIEAAAPAR